MSMHVQDEVTEMAGDTLEASQAIAMREAALRSQWGLAPSGATAPRHVRGNRTVAIETEIAERAPKDVEAALREWACAYGMDPAAAKNLCFRVSNHVFDSKAAPAKKLNLNLYGYSEAYDRDTNTLFEALHQRWAEKVTDMHYRAYRPAPGRLSPHLAFGVDSYEALFALVNETLLQPAGLELLDSVKMRREVEADVDEKAGTIRHR